jgi:hypothetical protein
MLFAVPHCSKNLNFANDSLTNVKSNLASFHVACTLMPPRTALPIPKQSAGA